MSKEMPSIHSPSSLLSTDSEGQVGPSGRVPLLEQVQQRKEMARLVDLRLESTIISPFGPPGKGYPLSLLLPCLAVSVTFYATAYRSTRRRVYLRSGPSRVSTVSMATFPENHTVLRQQVVVMIVSDAAKGTD